MAVAPLVAADGLDDQAVGTRTGELFAAHGRMVFAICRSILRDPHDVEDATQATFLSAHEALVRGSAIREPGAWLATIARNECRARLRGRRLEPLELRVEDLTDSVTTDDDAERRATVAHLRAAIAALPEKQRDAVVLRDLYGLRYGEICAALGVSRPSVEALLFRARRTLRVRLRPVGGVAIAVPLAVREGLAQAVPWFASGPAVGVSAAAGAGILAQLGGSVTAKLAVGALAVGVAGSAVGGAERRVPEEHAGVAPARVHVPGRVAGTPRRDATRAVGNVEPTPRTPVPETPPPRTVEPTHASQPVSTAVSTVSRTTPAEVDVGRPAAGRAAPTTAAPRARVPADLHPALETTTASTSTTPTRAEPPPARKPAGEPPRTAPAAVAVVTTTQAPVEPVRTEPARTTDTATTPTR